MEKGTAKTEGVDAGVHRPLQLEMEADEDRGFLVDCEVRARSGYALVGRESGGGRGPQSAGVLVTAPLDMSWCHPLARTHGFRLFQKGMKHQHHRVSTVAVAQM